MGRKRMADPVGLEGVCVSATWVRNVWVKGDTESHDKHLLRLEDRYADKGLS